MTSKERRYGEKRRLKIRAPSENPPTGKRSRKNIIKNPIEERER